MALDLECEVMKEGHFVISNFFSCGKKRHNEVRISSNNGACFSEPDILWESMWSPPIYQDSNRTVEGQTMQYMWTAGGLNRESSPKSNFQVHVQSLSSPPPVQSFIGTPTGDSQSTWVHSMWSPSGLHRDPSLEGLHMDMDSGRTQSI